VQSGRTEFVHCDHKYLSFKGSKFSKSRGAFVDVPYFLSRYDPDALRFYLTAVAPETRDTEFALAPVLPHTAQKLHEYLGYEGQLFGTQQVVTYEEETRSHEALTYDHSGAVGTWSKSALPMGQALREPAPLFKKLEESVVEEEYARLAG